MMTDLRGLADRLERYGDPAAAWFRAALGAIDAGAPVAAALGLTGSWRAADLRARRNAVLAAEDRATVDIEESKKQVIACMNPCWTARERNPAACVAKKCIKTELDKRIDECRHPTWLPL
jgi:hypothetical protein